MSPVSSLPGIKRRERDSLRWTALSLSQEYANIVVVIWDQFCMWGPFKWEQRPLVNGLWLAYLAEFVYTHSIPDLCKWTQRKGTSRQVLWLRNRPAAATAAATMIMPVNTTSLSSVFFFTTQLHSLNPQFRTSPFFLPPPLLFLPL